MKNGLRSGLSSNHGYVMMGVRGRSSLLNDQICNLR